MKCQHVFDNFVREFPDPYYCCSKCGEPEYANAPSPAKDVGPIKCHACGVVDTEYHSSTKFELDLSWNKNKSFHVFWLCHKCEDIFLNQFAIGNWPNPVNLSRQGEVAKLQAEVARLRGALGTWMDWYDNEDKAFLVSAKKKTELILKEKP
jgi:hypothetical protein